MPNDTIDTLLLRHYGNVAPVPEHFEQRLCASVRQQATELSRQQQIANNLGHYRVSRRRAVKVVAMATAGLGMLGLGLELVGETFSGLDKPQPAYS